MKNKNICIVGFVMGIIGCTVLADWQSLQGDPCDQYSYEKFSNSSLSVIGVCTHLYMTTAPHVFVNIDI